MLAFYTLQEKQEIDLDVGENDLQMGEAVNIVKDMLTSSTP